MVIMELMETINGMICLVDSNGQIQTSKWLCLVESTSSYDVIGLARNRIVEGSNYNGKSYGDK
ncbi:MAG: hypothetical protein KatS3mg091_208 [Patescibacteria group bacterium]|nr:MAG: hypothetical protein KatS3mg091_208 [Patescibacteria group bacterium]